jgi:hypothetical protein
MILEVRPDISAEYDLAVKKHPLFPKDPFSNISPSSSSSLRFCVTVGRLSFNSYMSEGPEIH